MAAVEYGLTQPTTSALHSRFHRRERKAGVGGRVFEAKALNLTHVDGVPIRRRESLDHRCEARGHFLTGVVAVFFGRLQTELERIKV